MKLFSIIWILTAFLFISSKGEEDNCGKAAELWTHGEGHYAQGSPESQRNLDSAINLCPAYANAWREKGVPYLKRGDFASWAPTINKAVELDPLGYLGIRGWCRFDFLRDYEGAIADLTRLDSLVGFHTMNASDYNIYLLIGQAKKALGQYDEALIYYDKCIANTIRERGENWVGLYDYLYRGILKYTMGNYAGALEDFDKQVKMYETLADPYYYKGLTLIKMGRKDESRPLLEKARELINGKGFKHNNPYNEMQDEIYLSDVEEALESLQ